MNMPNTYTNLLNNMKCLSLQAPNKKYFKRGELAAKQTEEYLRKHFPQDIGSVDDKVCT